MDTEALYANALNQISKLGPVRLRKLREYAGGFQAAWRLGASEIGKALGDTVAGAEIYSVKTQIDPDASWRYLETLGVKAYILSDAPYPEALRNIPTPPEILYVQGSLPSEEQIAIAVVGTRKPTHYGLEACAMLAHDLTAAGCAIVSGLARGIDTKAHETCLAASGTTVAVLGSGMDSSVLYPALNRRLAAEITSRGGAIVSEYPLTMRAEQWTFPQRNRIIAGLARGVLVVEANEKSGALITARFALETNKDVYAVPGQIFSGSSKGPHALIKEGATPVTMASDILDTYGIAYRGIDVSSDNMPTEAADILAALSEPKSHDEIARDTAKDAGETNRLLSLLEVHGMIKNIGQGVYRKL